MPLKSIYYEICIRSKRKTYSTAALSLYPYQSQIDTRCNKAYYVPQMIDYVFCFEAQETEEPC